MAERCEWNPTYKCGAWEPRRAGDCTNDATVSLGSRGAWHVCDQCAALPEFSKYRIRVRIGKKARPK